MPTSHHVDLAQTRQETPLLLLLDLVQDIHNLGSLLRTSEAVGVHGVVIQERRAAGVTPATVNTSSGAVEHLLVAQVTNLVKEIERLKTADLWIAGLEDVPDARSYTEINMILPLAIVVGSEGAGLRRLVRERCDWLMSILMRGTDQFAQRRRRRFVGPLRSSAPARSIVPTPSASGNGAV